MHLFVNRMILDLIGSPTSEILRFFFRLIYAFAFQPKHTRRTFPADNVHQFQKTRLNDNFMRYKILHRQSLRTTYFMKKARAKKKTATEHKINCVFHAYCVLL